MDSLKLHLGCGKRFLTGFVHIDLDEFSHVDHVAPMHELSMIDENSVSIIYSSHALEYYDRNAVNLLLKEWKRVLKPGGECFITVPDFDSLIQVYKQSGDLSNILGPIFGRWPNVSSGETMTHMTVWNEKDLSAKLRDNGFSGIAKFDPIKFLNSIDPQYDDYSLAYFPHMDRSGIQISLALRFTK
jgi:predicted SAM-dependent methyltransferase